MFSKIIGTGKVTQLLAKQVELLDEQIKLMSKQNDIQQNLIENLLARVEKLENQVQPEPGEKTQS